MTINPDQLKQTEREGSQAITTTQEKTNDTYHFTPVVDMNGVIDYTAVEPDKIYLANAKTILTDNLPAYLPPVEIRRRGHYDIPAVKLGENTYLLKGSNSKDSKLYKVSLDVYAALINYHLEYDRAAYKAISERSEDLRLEAIQNGETTFSPVLSSLLPKIPAPLDISSLPIDIHTRQNIIVTCKSQRVMMQYTKSNRIILEPYYFIREKLNTTAATVFTHHKGCLEDVKQKLLDMEMQKVDWENSWTKGRETAYGDANLDTELVELYGVTAKRQNGDKINVIEKQELSHVLDSVYSIYGDLSVKTKEYGLKVSHSGNTRMHASRAIGVFTSHQRAIGISFADGVSNAAATACHEFAHFTDNLAGQQRHAWFASDIPGTVENRIASSFRKYMNSVKGEYWNRTCECFARAMEEYSQIELLRGSNPQISAEAINQIVSKPAYMDYEQFEKYIRPLAVEFIEKNRSEFAIQTFDESKRAAIKEHTEQRNRAERNAEFTYESPVLSPGRGVRTDASFVQLELFEPGSKYGAGLYEFYQQIDDYLDKGTVPKNHEFILKKTPDILQYAGLPNREIIVSTRVIDKAKKTHHLSSDEIRSAIKQLFDPTLVFDSDRKNSEATEKSILVLTDTITEERKPVAMAINLDTQWKGRAGVYLVNEIRSIHDRTLITKDNINLIEKWTKNGLLKYVDDKKISDWTTARQDRFLLTIIQSDEYTIKTKSDYVNSALDIENYIAAVRDGTLEQTMRIQSATPEFKEWFGDWEKAPEESSQMINYDGSPKVFYHGTNNKFDVFDHSKGTQNDSGWLGKGFYFYGVESEALQYMRGNNGTVVPVYLNIRNPYYASAQEFNVLAELNSDRSSQEFTDKLIQEGYDGVFYNDDLREEAVVFSPNQIKSAVANTGLFRKDDPSIVSEYPAGYITSSDPAITREHLREAKAAMRSYTEPIIRGKKTGLWKAFRDFKVHGIFDITNRTIDTNASGFITTDGWQQLAQALRVYRDKRLETFRYVFVTPDGSIKDQLSLCTGLPNRTAALLPGQNIVEKVITHAEHTGTRIVLVHNHPSGTTTPSLKDIMLTERLEEDFTRSDGKSLLQGHIILDHETFGLYERNNRQWTEVPYQHIGRDADPLEKKRKPVFAAIKVREESNLIDVARSINASDKWNCTGWIPVLFAGESLKIRSVRHYGKEWLENSNSEDVLKEFRNLASETGASRSFPIIPDELALDRRILATIKNHMKNGCFTDFYVNGKTSIDYGLFRFSAGLFDTYTEEQVRTNTTVEATFDLTTEPDSSLIKHTNFAVANSQPINTVHDVNSNLSDIPSSMETNDVCSEHKPDTKSHFDYVLRSVARVYSTEEVKRAIHEHNDAIPENVFSASYMQRNRFFPPMYEKDGLIHIPCKKSDLVSKCEIPVNVETVEVVLSSKQAAAIIDFSIKQYKALGNEERPVIARKHEPSAEQLSLIKSITPGMTEKDARAKYAALYTKLESGLIDLRDVHPLPKMEHKVQHDTSLSR